jgi:hypothetical protein
MRCNSFIPKAKMNILIEGVNIGEKSKFNSYDGEKIIIPFTEKHINVWQKEALWNYAARYILEKYPNIEKLVFKDIDVYPAKGEEDWLFLVSDELERSNVFHPWTTVFESSGHNGWMSFSSSARIGLKDISSGQGFAVAMTSDWFKNAGGWKEDAIAGYGDLLTIMCWDKTGSHKYLVKDYPSMQKTINQYNGPKTTYGHCSGGLVHEWHGERFGKNDSRCYDSRQLLWELVGGPEKLLDKDKDGFWIWKDSVLADAVRELFGNLPTTPVSLYAAWEKMLKKYSLQNRNF